jgi:hypothetical protein
MKPSLFKFYLILAVLVAGGPAVLAQSNGVPGPADYAAFSRFITDRNIFDPTRQPYTSTGSRYIRPRPTRTRPRSTGMLGIQLVGTMDYEKGPFAFFNASSEEYRKALHPGDKLAGYTILEINDKAVKLETADKKELVMEIGDGLQPDSNGKWVFTKAEDFSGPLGVPAAGRSGGNESYSSSSSSTPATPPSASESNDVLKRLMEQREKLSQ